MLEEKASADILAFGFTMSSPSKIAGSKPYAFSLPAGPDFTCPGATDACIGCYAQKGRFHFKMVQSVSMRNWVTFSFFERNYDIEGCSSLLLAVIPEKAPFFRIHESGDFYSQFSVDVWAKIAEMRPNTNFYFYTRSFKLDFSKIVKLANIVGWASTDSFNISEAKLFVEKFKMKHAYGPWDHTLPIPENSFKCPATTNAIPIEKACEKCQLCVIKDRTPKNVVFLAH